MSENITFTHSSLFFIKSCYIGYDVINLQKEVEQIIRKQLIFAFRRRCAHLISVVSSFTLNASNFCARFFLGMHEG